MDHSTFEVRLLQWKSIIEETEKRPQGVSKHQWLNENGISEKKYYYWLRKVRKAALAEMDDSFLPDISNAPNISLVEIPADTILASEPQPPAVVIRTKKSTIEFSSNLSGEVLLKLLKAVSHAL